ncbi:MAG: aminodeoxychorismate synthase component I [Pseudomonadota bacterium]
MKVSLVYQEVPYFEDVSKVFAAFSKLPWAVFLDSGRPVSPYGRYEIFSAIPKKTFVTKGRQTIIHNGDHEEIVFDDPFSLLSQELKKNDEFNSPLPFTGGAIGFFSYDLGRRIERIPNLAIDDMDMPDMAVGIYHWAYVADHVEKKATMVGNMSEPRVRINWEDFVANASQQVEQELMPYKSLSTIQSNMTENEYSNKFSQVKSYISAGDCYQVNLAQRFSLDIEGDPWDGYKKIRTINPSPFSAYINIPQCSVLSASPERFLQVENNRAETKPIKGTRPRAKDNHQDLKFAQELKASTKDQAENVMIVDLLRNDLSKCCVSNSVKVKKLFEIESYPTVHHLVSTVEGKLSDHTSPIQLLRECFPGGSITGAPKIRSMEIIEELEPHRRGLYCGSIGYIGFNGRMDTNIAIRTLVQKNDKAYFYAGGGLVWDSQVDAEYQETFDKAAAMFKLFDH